MKKLLLSAGLGLAIAVTIIVGVEYWAAHSDQPHVVTMADECLNLKYDTQILVSCGETAHCQYTLQDLKDIIDRTVDCGRPVR